MLIAGLLIAVTTVMFQAGAKPVFPDDVLTSVEKLRIEKESKVENRIKVYESVSKRIHRAIEDAIAKNEFETLPANLQIWTSFLEESFKDIEANIKPPKKPRALIKYEIHLRKAVSAMQKSKVRIPLEQEEVFNSCLSRAAAVHRKMVKILFGH